MPDEAVVQALVKEEIARFLSGFEERLAASMQRALDTVVSDLDDRLRSLEEDQARILRHLGLDRREPAKERRDREVI